MKNTIWVILIGFLIGSCNPDEDTAGGNLAVNVKAVFGDEAFVMDEYYDVDGQKVLFNIAEFYITDIELMSSTGATEILDAAYVDFRTTQNSTSGAAVGETFTITGIPAGNYTSIKFGIGVGPDLNAQNPSEFEAESPLSNAGNWWSWNAGYIFSKFEGHVDTVGNADQLDVFYVYHTGNDENFQSKTFETEVEIALDETTNLYFELDLKEVMFSEDGGFSVIGDNQSHTTGSDAWIAKEIMENIATHLELK